MCSSTHYMCYLGIFKYKGFSLKMIPKEKAELGKKNIQSGLITKFSQLLNILTKTALTKAMGIHKNTLQSKIDDPGKITAFSILKLSECFDIDYSQIFNLIINELNEKKVRKKKAKK